MWDIIFLYVKVFVIGGGVCVIGQLLLDYTKLTSSRILVLFLLTGVLLEALGIFQYLKDFAASGVTVPILGFGSVLAKGAIEMTQTKGILGAIMGGTIAAAGGIAAATFFGYLFAILFNSKSKN